MNNIFVFDIETIPDVDAGRKLHGLTDLSDADVASAMFALQKQQSGNEFLPHYLQKICAISVVLRSTNGKVKVWTLGDGSADEKELLERFYMGIDKFQPTLVSWNGGGFDLPVINYRSLIHGVTAAQFWETGDHDNSYRYNNYIARYHSRHTDLMDVLAMYQPRANAPLDKIASLCGFPGKMGMSGAKVWDAYQQGNLKAIRDYCETDVLNTYLVYLRFLLLKGDLVDESYMQEVELVKVMLEHSPQPHLVEFLNNIVE